ncbi:uncharacterized protein LOC132266293 [Cornus florida]|uniref:uncharacterized protein LOC132266293 n=1 Tax=Cornus florida TaxID=4283 RepID=UPI00289774FC|nr:uncharacterized protein LOC132266293 [Cornus florida]
MTGDRTLFTIFKECSVGTVTFGDGKTSTVSGKVTDEAVLWHKRLGHVNYNDLVNLSNNDLVRGLPKLKMPKNEIYGPCQSICQLIPNEKGYRINRIRSDNGGEFEPKKYREPLGKFDSRSNEGVFLGYSQTSRAYRVLNLRTKVVMKFISVVYDDTKSKITSSQLDEEETNFNIAGERKETIIHEEERVEDLGGEGEEVKEDEDKELEVTTDDPIGIPAPSLYVPTSSSSRVRLSHPIDNVIGPWDKHGTRSIVRDDVGHSCIVDDIVHSCHMAQFEPKNVDEALQNSDWLMAMKEELLQFVKNYVKVRIAGCG